MRTRNLKCVVVTLLATGAGTLAARAWDSTGHMIVAEIAHERLNPKARERVDALAAMLEKDGVPYNAVNLACWPDDIKDKTSKSPFRDKFKPWHYIDIGCLPGDPDVLGHPPTLTQTNGDVIVALNHCVDLIKRKQCDELVPSEPVALALILHCVGDIHQPLHTTARYNPDPKPTDKYKDDAGGNGLTLTNLVDTPWSKNLHTFWDESYRRYSENDEVHALPEISHASAPGSADLKAWVEKVQQAATTNADLRVNFTRWILETHELACSQVYGTLGEPYGSRNVKLKEQYVADATRLARRQLALAGERLAAVLNELYGQ
jgi:hypothetical protein